MPGLLLAKLPSFPFPGLAGSCRTSNHSARRSAESNLQQRKKLGPQRRYRGPSDTEQITQRPLVPLVQCRRRSVKNSLRQADQYGTGRTEDWRPESEEDGRSCLGANVPKDSRPHHRDDYRERGECYFSPTPPEFRNFAPFVGRRQRRNELGRGISGDPRDRIGHPLDFWNIKPQWQLDAHQRAGWRFLLILFQTPPDLARLHPHNGVVASRIVRGSVVKDGAYRAFFQRFFVPIQPVLHHVFQELLTALAGMKEWTCKEPRVERKKSRRLRLML